MVHRSLSRLSRLRRGQSRAVEERSAGVYVKGRHERPLRVVSMLPWGSYLAMEAKAQQADLLEKK